MNKKLTQLTEKITSLEADDLLYVSSAGVSKAIRASTLEAPLKAYADQKKSEVISELSDLETAINTEISNRQAAITNTLNSANAYTDSMAAALESSIQQASGGDYSSEIQSLRSAISAEETSRVSAISFVEGSIQSVLTDAIVPIQEDVSSLYGDLNQEITARTTGDTLTLNAAKAYTDSAVSQVSPSGTSIPTGVIQMYAGTSAPTGWLLCDGSAVSRSTYSSLFTLIGTAYGLGNGSTTFNLPNPDGNANIRFIIKT
jgi:hypothetical protein